MAFFWRGREAILPHMDEVARLSDLGPGILDLNGTRFTSNIVGDVQVEGLSDGMASDLRKITYFCFLISYPKKYLKYIIFKNVIYVFIYIFKKYLRTSSVLSLMI